MNSPTTVNQKSSLHPIILTAAVALIVLSCVGVAAIMGWLPSSSGKADNANSSITSQEPGKGAMSQSQPGNEPVHHKPAASHRSSEPEYAAAESPRTCSECAVVESVHEIDTQGKGTGLGAAGGAVVGGLVGNQVGNGRGRELATIAGVVGGALVGNKVEGNMKTTHSYDITVRMNDGSTRTIHQAEQPAWRAGDKVKIVDGAIQSNG